MTGSEDTSFARLVSLACHDLRTPLATLHGFTRTLTRMGGLGEPVSTYLQMMDTAAAQLGDLLDDLGLAARIEGRRYEPPLQDADSLGVAHEAAGALPEGQAVVSGKGAAVRIDPAATARALQALARCALRHGGVPQVELTVVGTEITIAPVNESAAPVIMVQELKDLGAAVAHRVVAAQGGTVTLDGVRLAVRLPQ